MNVVQVGYGYWGANITKKLLASDKFNLIALCELNPILASKARKELPDNVMISSNYQDYLSSSEIEAFIIATQTVYSFEIGMNAMEYGKHVFMEKPLASTVELAEKLIAKSKEKGVILHCDHLLLYNPYYRYIKSIIDEGELGDIYYYDVSKMNLGPIRKDVNALMDLAVHDVAVIDWISGGQAPIALSAFGETPFGKQETLTYLTMKYKNFIAHIKSSWVSPVKVRRTMIAGTKKMVVFDDMLDEKVRIYNSGIEVKAGKEYGQYEFQQRKGDIFIPNIRFEDSLQNSLEYFESCVMNDTQSLSGPDQCLRVMKILEWSQKDLGKTGNMNVTDDKR